MFESLSGRFQDVFHKIWGHGKITEENISEALREVRRAMLEADVNLQVIKGLVARIKEKALGQEVLKSLSPGQVFIKIVNDELVALLGGEHEPLKYNGSPGIIMLAGLQGTGKTTTCGKLAKYLHKQGRRPLLVAADIYRPAAIQQLIVLGKQINIPVFDLPDAKPVEICKAALQEAKTKGYDTLILDTAGRLHIDEVLMEELREIRAELNPHEILLVVDAMVGQDAVNMAKAFNDVLELTGIIMTKMDGDTRGGAALSVKEVTGKPIKLIGMGEKLDALENFYPERIASRILGMGDVVSLVEKAQEVVDEDEAKRLEEKLRKANFTLEDFLQQMRQIKKIGSLEQIIGMIPGIGGKLDRDAINAGEKQLKVIEAIIQSMTPDERSNPDLINASRRRRIAKGSGNTVQEVAQLLKQFQEMQKMIKKLSGTGLFGGGGGKSKKNMLRKQQMNSMRSAMAKQFPMGRN
ncbi:MAG: signal recognition particle protein [Candidatus Sericytochromatia bacterium]|jgi:signal recognition particle subunit SRP54|nr:signal recognition particle protein [Candidatus Sericytochromatia bacterium]